MQRFLIASDTGKGRSFEGLLLCAAYANTLWEGGDNSAAQRPVYAMLGTTEQAAKPVLANIRLGKKLSLIDQRSTRGRGGSENFPQVEFLRSAEYRFFQQRTDAGVVITAYLPELFDLDASMVDPEKIRFCLLPSKARVAGQSIHGDLDHAVAVGLKRLTAKLGYEMSLRVLPDVEVMTRVVRLAPLFATCLDRRTRCPLIQTLSFHTQVLVGCLLARLVSFSSEGYYYGDRGFGENGLYKEEDVSSCGHEPGLAMKASHEAFEELLQKETKYYLSQGGSV